MIEGYELALSNPTSHYSLGPALYESIGRMSPQTEGNMHMIRQLFREVEWWEVYDLCETLVRVARKPEVVAQRIEAIFAQENLPYVMTVNGIDWRYCKPAAGAIAETMRLLIQQPEFQGPARQWQKALRHLASRPPDTENCIKDAVSAVEGVTRILSGREAETLSALIMPLSREIDMHPALAGIAAKLYAYRGDEQAVAHGAVEAPKDLTAEAELTLHTCAALIVYFAKKRGFAAEPPNVFPDLEP
jgi:hypothetical protein